MTNMSPTDILIEDAKNHLQTWGSQPPTFLLCNGALTAQLTMLPEKTNYLTNGVDGQKRLAQGPELASYRGLSIIHSRKFSVDAGTTPRDLLRRRVRVAEYYRIPWDAGNTDKLYEFYDQSRDSMFRLSWEQLMQMAETNGGAGQGGNPGQGPASDQNSFANEYWQPLHPNEPFHDFSLDSWNGRTPPPNARLRITSNGSNTALHFPPTMVKRDNPNIQFKMPYDQFFGPLSVSPEAGSVSTAFVERNWNGSQKAKTQYQHSSASGGGLFNDPVDFTTQITHGYTGVTDTPDNFAQALHTYKVVAMFNAMLKTTGLTKAAYELSEGKVKLSAKELQKITQDLGTNANNYLDKEAQFDTIFASISSITENIKSAESSVHAYMGGKRGTFEFPSAMQQAQGLTSLMAAGEEAGRLASVNSPSASDTVSMATIKQNPQIANLIGSITDPMFGPGEQNHAMAQTANALLSYYHTLTKWRLSCVLESNKDPSNTNCASHKSFKKFEKALHTCALDSAIQPSTRDMALNVDATGPFEAALQNPDTTMQMVHNIMNSGKRDHILTPNLHLDRIDRISSTDVDTDATSANPVAYVLQSLVARVPLDGNVCNSLLSQENRLSAGDQDNLVEEYRKFLGAMGAAHKGNKYSTKDFESHLPIFKTLIMHWFMSKFHTNDAIRARAKQLCQVNGDMEARLMQALQKCANENKTWNQEVQSSLYNLGTNLDAPEGMYYITSKASHNNLAIDAWSNDSKQLPEHYNHWYDMPVDATPMSSTNKTFFSIHDKQVKPTQKLQCTMITHPWTENVIAKISSLHFPLGVDYSQETKLPAKELADNSVDMTSVKFQASDIEFVVLGLFKRMCIPTKRFMNDGKGIPTQNDRGEFAYLGMLPTQGPQNILHADSGQSGSTGSGGNAGKGYDILILRPNIEHEMLGVIMGRGGTQELGATFWGQTELSCYDDSQHGIWGMSYK